MTTPIEHPHTLGGRWARAPLTLPGIYACAAAVLTWGVHGPTLHYGFNYDDYHFVRPYAASEIAATFSGPWDASGIEVPFYRPLTIVLYALRFHYFGVNAEAYHALSLVMFAACLLLFGLFVRRILASAAAGAAGMLVLAVHPAMPYSAVAWITNQMHLLQMLIVLSALLWWMHVRTRGAWWWMPLVGLEVAALLVKEDGVMLVPVILALHTARRLLVERDLRFPPAAFLAAALLAGAAALAVRHGALSGLGGYHLPDAATSWRNLRTGFEAAFRLTPARRPWQVQASWFVILLPLAAFAAWPRLERTTRFGLMTGLAIGGLFDLPFLFVVKVQQLHLVAMGAAIVLTSAAVAVVRLFAGGAARLAIVIALAPGIVALAVVSRSITGDFEPFGRIILATDDLVIGWAAVPAEIRTYLVEKKQAGGTRLPSNPADALSAVAFGLHGWEAAPDGRRFRWMGGRTVEVHVSASASRVTIPLRHDIGLFREPARVRVELDGRIVDDLEFRSGEWRASTLSLRRESVPAFARMHRIVFRLDRTWTPSSIDPRSTDTRRLGLQVGELQIR